MFEYEDLEDLDVVSQGDVIKWIDTSWSRPWQAYGVVVTADCDLAHEKHGGIISYVPAMLTDDFIWQTWRIEKLEGKLDEHLAKAGTRIGNWRAKNGASGEPLSRTAMRRWLERLGPEQSLDEIGVSDNGQRNGLLNAIAPAATILGVVNSTQPDFQKLAAAYAVVNPKSSAGDFSVIAGDIQKSWGSLPGDIFHLPSMPTPEGPETDGLFLYLRHIRQINADEVSARPDVIRSGQAKAQRVARVCAPYRYSITQSLARVFSDIGLPEDHEHRRRNAAQSFFSCRTQV